jgi:hypothetical protein
MLGPDIPDFAGQWDYDSTLRECISILKLMGQQALLRRRNVGDRFCNIFIRKHTVREMMGGKVDLTERACLVAATDTIVAMPPQHDIDRLILLQQPVWGSGIETVNLRIVRPVEAVAPAGTIMFWRMDVKA